MNDKVEKTEGTAGEIVLYQPDEKTRLEVRIDADSTSSILELVQKEGPSSVRRKIELYNLDVIISVGYRVNTRRGIRFRQWANAVLKQYLLQGYSINCQMVALQQHMDDRVLNQAVKRNINRFPERFMSQLKEEEARHLFQSRSQFVTTSIGNWAST